MQPDQPNTPFPLPPTSSRPQKPKLYGPGRPRTLDDGKRREICALIAGGCSLNDAARYVNCSVSTIRREADRNPDFLAQIRHAEKHARLSPLRAMQKAMSTHWRAAAWFLERAFPDRFSRPELSALAAREARALMKEIVDFINTEIRHPKVSGDLTKGICEAFDRYIRKANDRRSSARNLRLRMRSVEDASELAAQIDGLDLPLPSPESQGKSNPDFDQTLTAENPFGRRTEPLSAVAYFPNLAAASGQGKPNPLTEPPEHGANSSEPQSPRDFNIQ